MQREIVATCSPRPRIAAVARCSKRSAPWRSAGGLALRGADPVPRVAKQSGCARWGCALPLRRAHSNSRPKRRGREPKKCLVSVSRVLIPPEGGDGHFSRSVLADARQRPTRGSGRGQRDPPIRSSSRWGLPCQLGCPGCGELLPHRFTFSVAACAAVRRSFSVALSLSLRTVGVTHHLAHGSPDFPPAANAAGDRPETRRRRRYPSAAPAK